VNVTGVQGVCVRSAEAAAKKKARTQTKTRGLRRERMGMLRDDMLAALFKKKRLTAEIMVKH
jgi:hypothetical protein